ncbi:hypothetical protein Tco_0757323, partial [Tanacetum coccineum]
MSVSSLSIKFRLVDFSLDVNTGIDPVTTDSIRVLVPSPDRGRREGKAPMTEEEETQASRKTKEQILQEEAGLAEAIRLDALEKALEKEEVAKQVHLDSLLAQRMAEEQELTEEQKKRKAQVQFEAQSYTEEDWDTIRAKLEANAELKESVLGKDLTVEDYAKRMVELVNQRRKHFAEERARAKRNKPMTQTQLRNYMSNFLKNQGTWKLTQLKKLNFEEVKAEFEKLVKQLDTYVPMNFEATKESLKRFGEELQTKTAKKLKFDDEGTQPTEEKIEEDKDDKPTKKTGKRRKQIARKGFHTDHDRDESEDSDEANEKDDSTSGTKIPINPVPVATKSPSIANYKIIKQGRKGVYQIVRENGTDMVYISFGAMLTDISRDDLTELYRIVMKKHGMNEPEDEFEKVLWEYLKNMFEEPLSTDSIWSLPGQQRIICWRYYDACRVHCLNLESADVYMLIERKYPLSAEVCKAMLDKKLQGGKPDEDCYKLLKMMEKQAVEMVFSRPWTCTFLVAKGLTTPELMANCVSHIVDLDLFKLAIVLQRLYRSKHKDLQEITATIDGKVKTVFEASIRRHLKLEDSDGISNLPTTEIFEQLALMGYVSILMVWMLDLEGLSLAKKQDRAMGRDEHDIESDFEFTAAEEIYTAEKGVSTTELVSTVGASVSTASVSSAKDKGKSIIEEAETIQTKTKLQQEQERLGYEAALRLQEQLDEEERQRIARVHEAASSFNIEEWEDIQARI